MTVESTRTYTITDIGTLPGGSVSIARAVNELGWVVGEADVGGALHAFIYYGNAAGRRFARIGMIDLGTLGGNISSAASIDSLGRVAGYSQTINGSLHSFFWPAGGPLQDLGTLGGRNSAATAILSSPGDGPFQGQVVGWSETAMGSVHAFAYSGGSLQDLGPLGGTNSAATGTNILNQLVGEIQTAAGNSQAVLYSRGMVYELGTLGGAESVATGVNAAGRVVGLASTPSAVHAFLHNGSTMQDLGTLGGPNSSASAINAAGQIVGTAQTNDGGTHAFLFDGTMLDLNSVLPAGSGWELLATTGINDAGQITGFGTYAGRGRSFLLSPTGG